MRTIDLTKKWSSKRTIITALILIPIVIIASIGGYLLYMIEDLKSFAYQTPDTSYFYPEDQIDMPTLRVLANNFEQRQNDYHIPNNISQTIRINKVTQEVLAYHGTDNGGLHTAENLIATCFRFASLETGVEKDQALSMIEKMFYAIRLMIETPNGGLGPDYPASSIARFYASPEMLQDGNYTWIESDYFRHVNGTGKYSDWRIRLYTSKDEIAGIICALAAIQTLVDVPEIQYINNLLIAQVVEGFIDTYWQEISGDGKPDGAHLNPPSEPQWKLALLKMAANSYPDNDRYTQLYNYYLTKELAILDLGIQSDFDIIDNYYGLYFGANVVLAMMLVEDNPEIIMKYFSNMDDSYSSFIGHRNAYLNVVYLATYAKCLSLNSGTTSSFNIDYIVWDVKDQLWRFQVFDLFPLDNSYGGRNQTISRQEKDPNGINWTMQDPKVTQWENFIRNTTIGGIFEGIIDTLVGGVLDQRYIMPATVEMIPATEIMWNKNPFREDGEHTHSGDIVNEYAGASFSLPYWILTYFGYISEVNE